MLPIGGQYVTHSYRHIKLSTNLSTRILDTGGDGPVVILIHGLAASIEIWDRVIPELSKHCRVIAFDLPGYGEADRPDAVYDAPFFVKQLSAVMDALSIDRAHLVGSSLGASLVVRFSERHLHRIETAVLAAPGGFGSSVHPFLRVPTLPIIGYQMGRPLKLTNIFAVKLAMADQRNATKALINMADRYSKMPGGHRAFVRTLRAVIGPLGVKDRDSFEEQAKGLARPTLVIWGKQDRLFSCKQSDRAIQFLPDAKLLLLDGCGHYPQWEHANAFVSAVLRHVGAT
jgi:pimeloyl-ACP methyl ester carboxylesterase